MPPDRIEELLADTVAAKTDTAQIEMNQLELKCLSLETRAKNLLRGLEDLQIELADATDHDSPIPKNQAASIQEEIQGLLKALAEEHAKQKPKLTEIHKKLQVVEKRMQSLESLFPGHGKNN